MGIVERREQKDRLRRMDADEARDRWAIDQQEATRVVMECFDVRGIDAENR